MVVVGLLIAYLSWHKLRFPFSKVILLLAFSIYSAVKFLEADVIALIFVWFLAVIAASLALDILLLLNKEVNKKLAVASMLIVISGGGSLANTLIFLSSVDLWIKVFSLALLIVIHVPLIVALVIYLLGKKAVSKRLVERFYLSDKLKG